MIAFPPLSPVTGDDRFPPTDPMTWDEVTRSAAASLIATPRGEVRGPFVPLLRSPQLLELSQRLGAFLRYDCGIPVRLREFAICVTARIWSQAYEWKAHAELAAAAGVAETTLACLREGGADTAMLPDERTILDFCLALQLERQVDDALYARACDLLGERGTIELVGLCGYYSFLAMVLNVARTPVAVAPFAYPPG